MSRGYRCILVAALAGLVVVTLGTGIFIGALAGGHSEYQQAVGGNPGPGDNRDQPNQADTDRAGLPRIVERTIGNPEPQNGKDNEKRDLAAQEASATFAFWVVVAAFAQAIASIVGIYFIVLTLQQGGTSLRTAFSGLKQAGRAARAAEASVRVSKDTASRQLRAYLSIEDVRIEAISEDNVLGQIVIKNAGATPAKIENITVEAWPGKLSLNPKAAGPPASKHWQHRAVLNVRSQETLDWFVTDASDISRLKSDPANFVIHIYGRVDYRDFDDEPRFVEFAYRVRGGMRMGSVFMPCVHGNLSD